MHERVIRRHVGHLQHQHKVGPRRDAVALLHRRLARHATLELGHALGGLVVERDLDDGGKPSLGQRGRHHRDLAFDDAGLHQTLHAP